LRRNRHRIAFFVIASLLPLAALADGRPALREVRSQEHEVRFLLPADWSRADVPESEALLLVSPVQEAGWQTNVYVELAQDRRPGRSQDQLIETLVGNLERRRQDFVLVGVKPVKHASGLRGTELVYTHTLEGVALTEKELVLRLGDNRLLVVTGSATTPLWTKYQPEIDVVLGSIRPLEAPPASPASAR
jgi:hypothetical protein